jgi:hypothetical protein
MRICPKCNAYYGDDSTAFCRVDGTPLANVERGSDKWSKGARFIEEKEAELKKQKLKIKWRWIVMSAMTTLILTMIVAKSFTLETTPPPSPTPTPSPSSSPSPLPSPSRSPSPSPSPVVYRISGRVMSLAGPRGDIKISLEGSSIVTSATTDTNGYYEFGKLPAGGSYTITPWAHSKFDPPNHFVDRLRRNESVKFFQSDATPPPPECSERAMNLEAQDIVRDSTPGWEEIVKGEREIIRDKYAAGFKNAEVTLGTIAYHIRFLKPCEEFVVTATYAWQLFLPGNASAPDKTTSVRRERTFTCEKRRGAWRCS